MGNGSSRAFVGRERELAALRAGIDEARSGSPLLLLVVGEPGIGKTRLCQEATESERARGTQVLVGRCWEADGASPYWPWTQILRAHANIVGPAALARELGRGAALVAGLVPELGEFLSAPADAAAFGSDAEQARLAFFEAVSQCFRAIARHQPLLLIFDDLHAADMPSLRLLHFLVRSVTDAAISIVGTYRDGEIRRRPALARLFAQLGRDARSLSLEGFTESEVARFVAAATRVAPVPAMARALHQRTGGNPFYLDALVSLPATASALAQGESEAVDRLLPDTVRESIRQRLDTLCRDCADALSMAAVIGPEFDLRLLHRVRSESPEAGPHVLEEAVAAGLVRTTPDRPEEYRFAHALIRDAVYDDLSVGRRAALHAAVGAALEGLPGDDTERLAQLAHHFGLAVSLGHAARAAGYAQRAGAQAMRVLAYERATAHFEQALLVMDSHGHGDDRQRGDLLLQLADAQWRAGETAHASDSLLRTAEVARRLGDVDLLGRAAFGFAPAVPSWVADASHVALLEEALAQLPAEDHALRARLLARLALDLHWTEGSDRWAALSAEALAMARRVGDTATLAYAVNVRRCTSWEPANGVERRAATDEMLALAEASGQRELELLARRWRVLDLLESGNLAGVDEAIAAYVVLADQLDHRIARYWAAVWQTTRALLDGHFEAAEALIGVARRLGQRVEPEHAALTAQGQTTVLLRDQGRLDELAAIGEEWLRILPHLEASQVPVLEAALAAIFAAAGRADQARRAFDHVAAIGFAVRANPSWLTSMVCLADACVILGDRERAAGLYEQLRPYAGLNAVAPSGLCLGPVARTLGCLAAILQSWDTAHAHFDQALALAAKMSSPPLLARTQLDHAFTLAARGGPGEPEAARALAEQALVTARALGMAEVVRGAESLL